MTSLARMASVLLLITVMSGCWNQGNCQVHFGNVSLGKQVMDLKEALDAEALSPEEYQLAKRQVLDLAAMCKGEEDEGE